MCTFKFFNGLQGGFAHIGGKEKVAKRQVVVFLSFVHGPVDIWIHFIF